MISIIICSQHPIIQESLKLNIRDTIGVDYEIIHIDNSQHKFSIFEAYNKGVEKARGEFLCFMHEDVVYHSNNWGFVVEQHLALPFVGAIGVAGGCVIPNIMDWRFLEYQSVYLIQGAYTDEEKPLYYISSPAMSIKKTSLNVVASLDGVWICIRRELFRQIRFDETTFHEFHMYDTDICMQINKLGLGIFVTYDILLEHKSMGSFSDRYLANLKIFHNKWKKDLPMVKGMNMPKDEIDSAIERAKSSFNRRIKEDKARIQLRTKLIYQQPKIQDLTPQEKTLIDISAYQCRRYYINCKTISTSEVWSKVIEYIRSPYSTKRCRLLIKFIWQRIINCNQY